MRGWNCLHKVGLRSFIHFCVVEVGAELEGNAEVVSVAAAHSFCTAGVMKQGREEEERECGLPGLSTPWGVRRDAGAVFCSR